MKNTAIILLAIATVIFGWLAIRNAKPLTCDQVTYREDIIICEVLIKR